MKTISQPSNQPDLQILSWAYTAQSACLVSVGLIATVILCAWVVPGVAQVLPHGWSLMKADTSVAFLFGAGSMFLMRSGQNGRRRLAARLLAAAIMTIAGCALIASSIGHPIGLETVLEAGASIPGRMLIQTGVYLELIGLILILEGVRWKFIIRLGDILTLMLVLLVFTTVAGSAFNAAGWFGRSEYTQVAPQTLVCFNLLEVALICHRTRDGLFAVLVGHAIGSQTARITLPLAIMLPFLTAGGSAYAARAHWLSGPYAAALAASLCSILIFGYVVLMARRTNDLERKLRDISLTDELTRIHNRRAFYVLGEYALHEARRNHQQLTVLYFDLNGLKKVNDSLGHEVGSQLLIDAANLLRSNFRSSDIVARVGGDEFAVVAREDRADLVDALTRLDLATAAANRASGLLYRISYSMGEAIYEPGAEESFVELVERADVIMYERKRHRAAAREAAHLRDTVDETAINSSGVMATYVPLKGLR